MSLGVEANRELYGKNWWGEGEVKIYLDGDRESSTLAGTESEDYVGAAWALGQFANMYQGAPYADSARMRYSLYRFHVPDPVYFHNSKNSICELIVELGNAQGTFSNHVAQD